MKKAKDFTEEEKTAIIKRLKRAKPTKVAKAFDTTWQTVLAIKKANDERAKVDKVKKADTPKPVKNKAKLENEVLKMKVNALTEQVKKLRAVIIELA